MAKPSAWVDEQCLRVQVIVLQGPLVAMEVDYVNIAPNQSEVRLCEPCRCKVWPDTIHTRATRGTAADARLRRTRFQDLLVGCCVDI